MIRTLFYLSFLTRKYPNTSAKRRCSNTGWTLLETLFVSVIVGILASWTIPNMVEGIEKRKAQNALSQVKGTLQEAQRNAIKMGKECKIIMDMDVNPTYLAVDTATQYLGCLGVQRLDFSGITVTENFPGTGIRFSYRGNTTNIGTIVIESSNARTKYCLVVSNFLGIMRSGIYNGTTEGSISASNCQSSF